MKKRIFGLTSTLIVAILCQLLLVTTADAQTIRWLRVGQLQSFIVDYGSENELTPVSNNSFSWPAQYGDNQYTSRMKSLWIGATNFYDPVEKTTKSVKVVGSGPRYDATNQPLMIFPQSIKLIGRVTPPKVKVNNQTAGINEAYDKLDEVDPNLPCDRMIVIKFNTSMGVSVTKKVMAFSQQNHDSYFIYEYTFKNTGIYNAAGDVYQQTLNNFWAHYGYRYAFSGVTSTGWNSTWGDFASEWGTSSESHDFGPFRPLTTVAVPTTLDTLRGFYAFYGPDKNRTSVTYDQDWGCPKQDGGGPGLNGLLGSAKYAGAVTLYAPVSVQNRADDPMQPATTSWFNTDDAIERTPVSQYDDTLMQQRFTVMTEGHLAQSMEEAVGSSYVNDFYTANPTRHGGNQGQGYGPYTLAPGDSIKIVFAEGVSGISWEKCREVGAVWYEYYKGTSTPPLVFPAGKTGTTYYTDYSKAWVQSGKDSLLRTFRNARANFRSGYMIPQPPSAPDSFKVENDMASGSGYIRLTWANNATSASHFDGYVIYRSVGSVKDYRTEYQKVFECNAADVVHTWEDSTVTPGAGYYYYIQSKDDGTQNDVNPGTPLYSSMFFTMTSLPTSIPTEVNNQMKNIPERFALLQNYPNPFNPSTTISFGLPIKSFVTLRIYDLIGREVSTIVSEELPAGNYNRVWNAANYSNGIYFYRLITTSFINTKKMILIK